MRYVPIFKKIPLVVFVFLLFFGLVSQVNVVRADNDTEGERCTAIVIGGQRAASARESAPLANADRAGTGDDVEFDVSVTLSPTAQVFFNNCGSASLRLSVYSPITWPKAELVDQGGSVFVGVLTTDKNIGFDPRNADVEVDTNQGNCFAGDPICRRVYIRLDGDTSANVQLCNDAKTAIESELAAAPNEIEVNGSLSISLPLTQEFYDSCNITRLEYTIKRGTNQVQYGSLDQANNTILFTPTAVGRYQITFVAESIVPIQVVAKNFCVAAVGGTCTTTPGGAGTISQQPFQLCSQIPDKPEYTEKFFDCCECASGTRPTARDTGTCPALEQGYTSGLWSAVGCIRTSQEGIVTHFIRTGLGIAGGIALLMILAASFMLTTSQGEPKRAGEARELLTSAVIGLLFIIFSVTILQFIGVTILKIPGFGN